MTPAEFLKLKLVNRANAESWQRREYQTVMGRDSRDPVKLSLTLRSGARVLRLNGDKPPKAGLLKAFIA